MLRLHRARGADRRWQTAGNFGVPIARAARSHAAALAARTASDGAVADPSDRSARSAVLAATQFLPSSLSPAFIVVMTASAPGCAAGAPDPLTDDTAAADDAERL